MAAATAGVSTLITETADLSLAVLPALEEGQAARTDHFSGMTSSCTLTMSQDDVLFDVSRVEGYLFISEAINCFSACRPPFVSNSEAILFERLGTFGRVILLTHFF